MKILIVSDTHGYDGNFYKLIKKTGTPDMLIHAGDVSGSEYELKAAVNCPVKMVSGNNDFGTRLRSEEEFEVEGLKFLLVHGHRDGVYYGTDRLLYKAAERGADIVIYGHTHVPLVEYDEELGIWAVNPGSLSLPRQFNHKPSFILLDIDSRGEPHFTVNYL